MSNLKDYFPFDKWIAKEDMKIGSMYFCKARNFKYGVWDGFQFVYIREKLGGVFADTERHWDDGAPFGTVKPFEEIK